MQTSKNADLENADLENADPKTLVFFLFELLPKEEILFVFLSPRLNMLL